MPRRPRMFQDKGVYHLISRGNNRKSIFEIAGGYQRFKEVLCMSLLKFNWRIYHYCFMPNHLHILALVDNGRDLPMIMKYVLQSYSRWYRGKTEYAGYLWQGRYKSPLIEEESYLLECGRYIERNPIRAKLINRIEDYPWSSYRYYAFGQNDPLVQPNPSFMDFGQNAAKRQQHYKEFVKLRSPYEPMLDLALTNHRS